MKRFDEKIAVITGGTTGIGLATARSFAAEGARVVVTGRNPETLARARSELAASAVEVLEADSAKLADLERTFEHVRQRYGRIDVLFVNAGRGAFRPIEAADEQHFDEIFDLNVKGAYFTIQKALPLLVRGSSIVLNTSVAAARGFPATSVYAASKAALAHLTRALGAELVERGIRVNAVSPGPIETPIYDKLGLDGAGRDALKAGMAAQNPMKRFGSADELARTVLFLSGNESSYVTGVELAVDGGAASF